MFTRSLLSGVPFVLLSLLAADAGAPAGGGSETPPPKPEEKKPAVADPAAPAPAPAPAPAAPAPAPAPVPAPAPAPAPAATAAAPVKPSIFARAAALLKPQSELAQTIATHEATIAGHVATIAARDKKIIELNAELQEVKTGMTELETSLDTLALNKAIDIAAGQGTPPVVTAPGPGATVSDEIAATREQAAGESDPVKRAELHAKANRMADSKKNAGNN